MQFEDSMNDSCHLSWPMRPVDAAYMRQRSRLAVSPPTPPQSAQGEVKRMPTPPSTSSTAGSARRPQFRFLRQKQSPSQTLQGAEASEDDSSDETCVPSSGSSCQDSDEDWDLDYEALRRSSASCVHDGDDVSLDRLRMAFGTLSFDASHLVNDGPQDDHSER